MREQVRMPSEFHVLEHRSRHSEDLQLYLYKNMHGIKASETDHLHVQPILNAKPYIGDGRIYLKTPKQGELKWCGVQQCFFFQD